MNETAESGLVSPVLQEAPLFRRWLDGGIAILNLEHRITDINPALANWLALDEGECRGKALLDLLVERFPEWLRPIQELLNHPDNLAQIQTSVSTGQFRQWFTIEAARNTSGVFVRLGSILPPQHELAEAGWDEFLQSELGRRDMFLRLLRAEAQLDNLIHRWPGVIFSQRADFSFQYVSPKIEELTGVGVEEWRRQPQRFWQVVHESDAEELRQQLKRLPQSPQGATNTYRIRHVQTGRVAYVLEHRQAVTSKSGLLLGYEGVWLDVTRQTIAEKRLSSAAWKETLAVLTMGLAHDFSNIMAGIHSLSESFLVQVNSDHPFQEGLALIKQHSLQASQLVHRIINLHHGKTGERQYCSLNEIVADLVDLVEKILPRRVQVETHLSPDTLALYVDPVEFRQVIINLTLNAADAMPQGGKLQLQTGMFQEFPATGHREGAWPRLPAICLTVRDTGCGIHPRHLASIFDPFFTTKAMNKGSGLGLYNARLFVEKHQGAISVESTEGVGTAFHIWLPQADFTEEERSSGQASSPRRSLLLAGAAGQTLNDTAEFLRLHGYHVVVSSQPGSAVENLRNVDYQFVGLMLLMGTNDREMTALVREVRQQKLPLKIIVQAKGCNQDELDGQVLRQVDVILSPDLPEERALEKLASAFEGGTY